MPETRAEFSKPGFNLTKVETGEPDQNIEFQNFPRGIRRSGVDVQGRKRRKKKRQYCFMIKLVEASMQVDLTKEIPPRLYRAVAEIPAFIYRLEKAESRAST